MTTSLLSGCLTLFVWATVFGQTLACSGTELLDCVTPLERMSTSQYADPKTVCQEVHRAIECFEREVQKCPGPPHLLNNLRQHFNEMRSMCDTAVDGKGADKKEEGNQVCSADDLMACVAPLSPDSLLTMDASMACLEIHNAVECVHKEMDTCPNYLKPYIDGARQQLDMVRSQCDPFRPSSSSSPKPSGSPSSSSDSTIKQEVSGSVQPPCHWSRIHNCVWSLDRLLYARYHVDAFLLCREYDKAARCLRKESALCPTSTSTHLWSAQLLVDEVSMSCDRARIPKQPKSARRNTSCVQDDQLKTCLIHNQMRVTRGGERRKEPLGQDKICLMVGESLSCMAHYTDTKPTCNPHMANRMSTQFQEQKAQCKQLGYPTNKAVAASPTTLLILTVISVPVFLRHFL